MYGQQPSQGGAYPPESYTPWIEIQLSIALKGEFSIALQGELTIALKGKFRDRRNDPQLLNYADTFFNWLNKLLNYADTVLLIMFYVICNRGHL